MKVEVELRNGAVKSLPEKLAKVWIARGLARKPMGYQTRELRAAPQAAPVDEADALRAELDRRGIKYHHRAGPAKLRELLEG